MDGHGGARLLSAVEKDIVPHGGAGQGQASDLDDLALARVGILKGAGGGDAQFVAAELAVHECGGCSAARSGARHRSGPDRSAEAQRLLGRRSPALRSFDGGLKAPSTDIYRYEMPGGQYTNLQSQVEAIGLGSQFEDVRDV